MKIYLIRGDSSDGYEQNKVLSVHIDPNEAEDIYKMYQTNTKNYCFVYIDEWETE